MTIVGIALGVGSFVAVLGVTASANGQIGDEFLKAEATQITVTPSRVGSGDGSAFAENADSSVMRIGGVASVGRWWAISDVTIAPYQESVSAPESQPALLAATPGYLELTGVSLASGRTFDDALANEPVALVGEKVAQTLGIRSAADSPVIVINRIRFCVIGVIEGTTGSSAPLTSVVIPAAFARSHLSPPGQRETMVVTARTGAAQIVSEQIPLALNAYDTAAYHVVAPPRPSVVRDRIQFSTQTLFFALSGICLLVSGVGIANISLLGVVARTREIALRRTLGARPRHIASQFLIESAVRGLLGGLIGTSLAVVTTAAIALTQHWTAIIEPWSIVGGPFVGVAVGALAGLYPAIRATRVEPVEAFRL